MQVIINMTTVPKEILDNHNILEDEITSWLSDLGYEVSTTEINAIPKPKISKRTKTNKIDLNRLPK